MCWFFHKWEVVRRKNIWVKRTLLLKFEDTERAVLVTYQCKKCGKKRCELILESGTRTEVPWEIWDSDGVLL